MVPVSFTFYIQGVLKFKCKTLVFKLFIAYNDARHFLIFKIIRLAHVRCEFETSVLWPCMRGHLIQQFIE